MDGQWFSRYVCICLPPIIVVVFACFCTTFRFWLRSQVITNPGVSVHTIDAHVTDNDIVKAGKAGHHLWTTSQVSSTVFACICRSHDHRLTATGSHGFCIDMSQISHWIEDCRGFRSGWPRLLQRMLGLNFWVLALQVYADWFCLALSGILLSPSLGTNCNDGCGSGFSKTARMPGLAKGERSFVRWKDHMFNVYSAKLSHASGVKAIGHAEQYGRNQTSTWDVRWGGPDLGSMPRPGDLGLPFLSVLGRDITPEDITKVKKLPLTELVNAGIYKQLGQQVGNTADNWVAESHILILKPFD